MEQKGVTKTQHKEAIMMRDYVKEKVLARGRKISIGIDVHKESWQVTAISEGEELFHGRMPGDYSALRKLLNRFVDCQIRIAYEAGCCGFGLYDRLKADGIEALVVPPSLIPVESGNKVKTDRRDSRKLARLLEGNLLKRVHVPTEQERAYRELLRTRRQLVNHRSDVERQIKSKLLFYSIRSPLPLKQQWTGPYLEWLKSHQWEDTYLKVCFDILVRLCEDLTSKVKELNQRIKELAATETYKERLGLLKTVPGIGTLTAMEILTELQEMSRFGSAQQLASYLGLTPSEYSSGDRVRQGRITRCGNKRVRSCLVESSWFLISKDPKMREKYLRIKYRRGAKRAIIAIARNLSGRIRHMLLNHEPYMVQAAA